MSQPEIAKKIHKTPYFGVGTVIEIQRLIGQKSQILPTPSHLAPSFLTLESSRQPTVKNL